MGRNYTPESRPLLKPRLIQLIIHPLVCRQLEGRSLLDDFPIVDDHNLIRIRDGREAVREIKPPPHHVEAILQSFLPPGIAAA
jgi:hypothetical protein